MDGILPSVVSVKLSNCNPQEAYPGEIKLFPEPKVTLDDVPDPLTNFTNTL